MTVLVFFRSLLSHGNSLLDGHAFTPRKLSEHRVKIDDLLFPAKGSVINSYGYINLTLDLGLLRNFGWRFVVDYIKFTFIKLLLYVLRENP